MNTNTEYDDCPVCDTLLMKTSSLRENIYIHTGKKGHKCKLCDKLMTKRVDIERHLLYHECFSKTLSRKKPGQSTAGSSGPTSDPPPKPFFYCPQCRKGFNTANNLREHLTTHDKPIDHKCEECNQEFKKESDLKLHVLIHSISKSKAVASATNNTQQVVLTPTYNVTEVYDVSADGHVTIMQNDMFASQHDSVEEITHNTPMTSMATAIQMTQMTNVQPIIAQLQAPPTSVPIPQLHCSYCSKIFTSRDSLNAHVQKTHRLYTKDAVHKCDTCGTIFVNVMTLNKHVNESHARRKLRCSLCPKKFAYAHNLRTHMKNVHGQNG